MESVVSRFEFHTAAPIKKLARESLGKLNGYDDLAIFDSIAGVNHPAGMRAGGYYISQLPEARSDADGAESG